MMFCTWIIAPANASRVELRFSSFETQAPASATVGDWVQVFACHDATCSRTTLLGSFAGSLSSVPPVVASDTGVMMVRFNSDENWVYAGFQANYSSPCPPATFGLGLPHCRPCRTSCPPGKRQVPRTCGTHGAAEDDACECPVGQFARGGQDDGAPCSLCPEPCPAGELSARVSARAATRNSMHRRASSSTIY